MKAVPFLAQQWESDALGGEGRPPSIPGPCPGGGPLQPGSELPEQLTGDIAAFCVLSPPSGRPGSAIKV